MVAALATRGATKKANIAIVQKIERYKNLIGSFKVVTTFS